MKDWQIDHKKAIDEFLQYLNKQTDQFVLKGGTALLECYNLNRFSEDIDLDGKSKNIEQYIKIFCINNDFSYRVAKDTNTVKRFMINYGNVSKPLKVEISFRKTIINETEINKINNIIVYNLDTLLLMKTNAYIGRDKIRDLYDVSFICNNYYNELSSQVLSNLRNALDYKGLEHFDYIVNQQNDELIDSDKLAEEFLKMYDLLGLLQNETEQEIATELNSQRKPSVLAELHEAKEQVKPPKNTNSKQAVHEEL